MSRRLPPSLDFRRLAESLPHLVWTCQADGPCDYLSPQWAAYTGVPVDEQFGYGWLERLHPDDRAPTAAAWQRSVQSRTPLEVEFRIRRHDGVYRWFATRAVPVEDDDGTVTRWYGTNTDVQALRDAQDAAAAAAVALEQRVAERTAELEAATRQLRATQHALEMAQAIAHVGSWSFDLQSNEVRWSAELFRILRVPVAELAPPYEVHHTLFAAADWPRLDAAVARAVEFGEPYELDLELAPSDDGPRFAMARGEAERNEEGRVVRLFGTFQDVTELERTRRRQAAAAERLELAANVGGMAIWEWDIRNDVLRWDARMHALYGVPDGTPLDYDLWRSRVHPEDRADAEASVRAALDGNAGFATTFRVLGDGEGGERWVRGIARVLRDGQQRPLRMLGVNFDVTAEERVRRVESYSLRMLREFVRQAPVAIAMLDRSLRYVAASDHWRSDYALGDEPLDGTSHMERFPWIPDHWRETIMRGLSGETHRAVADAFVAPDGSPRWIDWEVHPWQTADGAIGGIVIFTRDVTLRVQMQVELGERTAELERSNTDLRQFAYAASHDLQEPLRAVAGCAHLLRTGWRDRLDGEAIELIDHMVDGADRMRRLIADLLAYSRVGTHASTFDEVPLEDALGEVRANLQVMLEEADAHIDAGPLPVVRADYGQMVQLLQNLVANAVKFRRGPGPHVSLRSWAEAGRLVVAVRDDGVGIPADAHERVFQVFQRLHTRDEYEGTGIGLALCRRIVDRHGGQLWIEPVDGPGTEFRFSLPGGSQ